MEDILLQDGSEVFKVGGGKSVQIGNNSHDDTHSLLLILRDSEGTLIIIIVMMCNTIYTYSTCIAEFDHR